VKGERVTYIMVFYTGPVRSLYCITVRSMEDLHRTVIESLISLLNDFSLSTTSGH